MKTNMNSVAGYAAAMVKNAFAFVCVLVVSVLVSVSFVSCESEVDTLTESCPTCGNNNGDNNNKPENPEDQVKNIDHYGCDYSDITWREENATITRAASYDLAARDGGIFGTQTVTYLAEVTYTNGEVKTEKPTYKVNYSAAGFGYKGVKFVKNGGMEVFASDPQIKKDGDITFLTYGERTIAFRTVAENSVKSVTIAGQEMTDLCNGNIEYSYDRTEVIAQGDSADFNKFVVRVHGIAKVSADNNSEKGFYVEMAYREAKSGQVVPPTEDDKEPVKYDVVNKNVTSDGVTGDLEVIYSDGSRENLGKVNISLNKSTFVNEEQTIKVIDFSYNKLEPSFGKNIKTGNVRNDEQLGCKIQITEMKNTIIMKTSKAVVTMGGLFEFPVLIDPLGGEHSWNIEGWNLNEVSITDDGGNGNKMVITYTANASYVGASENLASIVNLVKDNTVDPGDPEQPTVQTGAYAKDARIEGSYIKWTLVRTYNNTNDSETPMSIRHMGKLTVESRKSTTDRTYAATTPSMDLISSEPFEDGNYYGTFAQYTSHFVYADFTNEIASQGRTVVNYNDNGYKLSVWNEGLLVEKTGVEKGTSNISDDANKVAYLDLINYHLTNGGTEVATGKQEVVYSEDKEIVDPTPEDEISKSIVKKGIVNGKLVYTYTETHSQKPELNVTEEGSVALVYIFNVASVADWTAKAGETGFSLTGSANQTYSGAKDYIFASNRGNNVATVSMQTAYTVSAHGISETLTITGNVTGAVALVNSSESANTYSFTGKLFADNVEIASKSDNAIETIEKDEPSEPEQPETPDFGIVAVYSTVTFNTSAQPQVTMAAKYNNGNCVIYINGQQVYKGAAPSGVISAIPSGNGWQAASIQEVGDYYVYSGINGGKSTVTKVDITYNRYPSGILSVNTKTNEDGTVTASNNYASVTFGAY